MARGCAFLSLPPLHQPIGLRGRHRRRRTNSSLLAAMPALIVELDISASEMLAYYRGQARSVRARATTGQYVQFPASVLQRHITHQGVQGRFLIEFDANHKFIRLEPLG